MYSRKMPWLEEWRGLAALMKPSPTVIYDIGMCAMVTMPVGWVDLQRNGCEVVHAACLFEWERWEGQGNAYPQLISRSQFY